MVAHCRDIEEIMEMLLVCLTTLPVLHPSFPLRFCKKKAIHLSHQHPIEFILSETSFVATVAATRQDLVDAIDLAARGAMTVPIAGRFPLDGVQDALDTLRQRGVLGRQVLDLA